MSLLWLIFCCAVAYLLSAMPWSVWLGAWFFARDPRRQRDGNPGAANAFRAAGWQLGLPVLTLDFFKAFLPVAAGCWILGFTDPQLFWLACMSSLGHAFSVFLGFRGGRGIVVMFGVWAGLTLYQVPIVLGCVALGGLVLLNNDEYRALALPVALIAYLLITRAPGWMVLLAVTQLGILALKIGIFLAQSQRHGGGRSCERRQIGAP